MSFQHQHAKPAPSSAPDRPAPARARASAPSLSNQAVSRFLSAPAVQTKLAVNTPGDEFEREADGMAEAVMRTAAPHVQRCAKCSQELSETRPHVQRMCSKCAEEEEHVQMKSQGSQAPEITADSEQEISAARAGGQPLSTPVRSDFEQRFQHDFSSVRVHSGPAAARSAQTLNASAYTLGADIVFGHGQFAPGTAAGQKLLAHELTHVIQQGQGAPLQIQRQDIDDLPDFEPPIPPPQTSPRATPVVAINDPPEPGCPGGQTNLGNLTPDPPCADTDEIVDGLIVKFCRDSDIFASPGDRDSVRNFAQAEGSRDTFKVQGWSSTKGPGTPDAARQYNLNLSCHRAKRVARELVNAGVREERIAVTAKGPTDRFQAGNDQASQSENQIAVIGVEAANVPGAPAVDAGATLRQIADAARQSIINGNYFLGADAYVARWTCGQFRSLSDIVRRVTVLIEGDDFPSGGLFSTVDAATHISFTLGEAAPVGLNTVNLSGDVALTDNPLACAENRIADLAFHQFVRPQIPSYSEQHRGALHMLALGGFDPCRRSLLSLTASFAIPNPTDPQAGHAPPCADKPLEGAINPQNQPATPVQRPAFALDRMDVAPASGPITVTHGQRLPSGLNLINLESDPGSITVDADVTATGSPSEIAKYDIGFVQTLVTQNRFVTYVGGQRIRWNLPLPLRDGPPRTPSLPGAPPSPDDPPWYERRFHWQAHLGTQSVQMTDSPSFGHLPTRFVDLSQTRFASERSFPQPGQTGPAPKEQTPTFVPSFNRLNPARDAQTRVRFLTWVVARRNTPPAPISVFSTEFLGGKQIVFALHADLVTSSGAGDTGTGHYSVISGDSDAGDIGSIQLRGATPADFEPPGSAPLFNEFLTQEGTPSRLQAPNQLDVATYRTEVERIAAGPRAARGLRGPLRVDVRIDLATGRVVLDDLNLSGGAVVVTSTGGAAPTADQLRGLALDIFPEVRRLVLGHVSSFPDTDRRVFPVPFTLTPLP